MESGGAGGGLKILHIDNHLLAVDKPSGVPSQPDASGDTALDDLAKEYLRREFGKPGEVYLALLHRLDRPTSGVILMARTGKAAGRMAELFRKREMEKTYLALVECASEPSGEGRLEDVLIPAAKGSMRIASGKGGKDAREARLGYRVLGRTRDGRRALLRVDLETGVKHQIRCQLAHAGLPVVGDFRYGPFGKPARPEAVMGGRAVLLHALEVGFVHPVRREPVRIAAPPPDHWAPFLGDFPDAVVGRADGNQ